MNHEEDGRSGVASSSQEKAIDFPPGNTFSSPISQAKQGSTREKVAAQGGKKNHSPGTKYEADLKE